MPPSEHNNILSIMLRFKGDTQKYTAEFYEHNPANPHRRDNPELNPAVD